MGGTSGSKDLQFGLLIEEGRRRLEGWRTPEGAHAAIEPRNHAAISLSIRRIAWPAGLWSSAGARLLPRIMSAAFFANHDGWRIGIAAKGA